MGKLNKIIQAIKNYGAFFEIILVVIYVSYVLIGSYVRGPIYQLYSAETSYILLFNGVNLLEGKQLGFIVHSLPLIEVGAIISLVLYFFEGGYSLADSVVVNAETYSIALDIVLFVFVGMGMVRFFRCLRKSVGLKAAMFSVLPFIAMTPWGYLMVLHGAPEFLGLGCAFWALSFLMDGFGNGKNKNGLSVVIAGIFAGLGFAAKVNFLPVLLATLLVARPLIPFIISIVTTVIIVYLPVVSQLKELLVHFGPSGVVWQGNPTSQKGFWGVFDGFQVVVNTVPMYVVILFFLILMAIVRAVISRELDKSSYWLMASAACGFLALLLTSLRPLPWYLISSLPFLSVGLAVSGLKFPKPIGWKTFGVFGGVGVFVVLAFIWFFGESQRVWNLFGTYKGWIQKETLLVDSRSKCAAILQYPSRHPLAAIFHGDHYSGGELNKVVRHHIPSRFFWHYAEHPDLLFDRSGRRRLVSQALEGYPCAMVSGTPLQESYRPAHVEAPTLFNVKTYCPSSPTFGYNCETCTKEFCLGYVVSYQLGSNIFSVEAPRDGFPPENLIDGNSDTFWEIPSAGSVSVELNSKFPVGLDGYALSTGNHGEGGHDAISRMPKRWKLYAKTATGKWLLLDDRVTTDWAPNENRFFDLRLLKQFSDFKFEFEGRPESNIIRIYEIRFKMQDNRQLKHPDSAHNLDRLIRDNKNMGRVSRFIQ